MVKINYIYCPNSAHLLNDCKVSSSAEVGTLQWQERLMMGKFLVVKGIEPLTWWRPNIPVGYANHLAKGLIIMKVVLP